MNQSVAVLILCQPSELRVAALTLHHLVRDLNPTGTAAVLMNGGYVGELRAASPASPYIEFYSSPANLGVAGGRNFLLRSPTARAADVIVILDNDVITPPGHIGRMVATLSARPDAGVVGPAILQLSSVASALGLNDDDLRAAVGNEALQALGKVLLDQRSWFHLGTNPDWRSAYIDEVQLEQRLVAGTGVDVDAFAGMNHEDPSIRGAVADRVGQPIASANIAGCCQAFRRELLDEIGPLRDEYSPYGFEDVDFCVRALRAGRRNFVDPSVLMLHGTDQRHAERRVAAQVAATQQNFMRCKSLFAWHHVGAGWQTTIEASIVRRYLLNRQSGRRDMALVQLRAHLAGVQEARRQIRHASAIGKETEPAS